MTSKERLREYIEKDALYQEYLAGDTKDLTDFDKFCIQHCKDIEELLKENEDLKKQLEGVREERDYLFNKFDIQNKYLAEDNKELRKQLEEYKEELETWKKKYGKIYKDMNINIKLAI